MVSLTHWTWIWANSRRWRTGKPGVLQSWGCREWDTIWRLNNHKIQNSSEWKYFRSLKYIFKEMFYLRLHVLRISALQFSSVAQLCPTLFNPMTAAHQASLCIINSQSLLKLMSIESVMPSNHPILCCPLLLPPSIFPSIRVFSSESVLCIRWPEYWSFSFNISPSNEYSGLISFRIEI